MKKLNLQNSAGLHEAAHDEPLHLDLHCLTVKSLHGRAQAKHYFLILQT